MMYICTYTLYTASPNKGNAILNDGVSAPSYSRKLVILAQKPKNLLSSWREIGMSLIEW